MQEAKALQILRDALEAAGGKTPITALSVLVHWGQHELQGLGNIRKFMIRNHEVFRLEGTTVILLQSGVSSSPKTSSTQDETDCPGIQQSVVAPDTHSAQNKRSVPESDSQLSDPALKKHKRTCVTVVNDTWWASEEDIQGVDLLVGQYQAESYTHDGHDVFKKKDLTEGPIFLFYWKGRDGWDQPSWWFSNEVGSQSAWAYAEGEGFLPSSKGWQLPLPGSPQLSGLSIKLSELGGAAQQKSDEAAQWNESHDATSKEAGPVEQTGDKAAWKQTSQHQSQEETWDSSAASWKKPWSKSSSSSSWSKSWKEDKDWEQKKEGSSWSKSWKKEDASWDKTQEAASSSSWNDKSWKKDAGGWS